MIAFNSIRSTNTTYVPSVNFKPSCHRQNQWQPVEIDVWFMFLVCIYLIPMKIVANFKHLKAFAVCPRSITTYKQIEWGPQLLHSVLPRPKAVQRGQDVSGNDESPLHPNGGWWMFLVANAAFFQTNLWYAFFLWLICPNILKKKSEFAVHRPRANWEALVKIGTSR